MTRAAWVLLAATIGLTAGLVHLARRFDELELLLDGHLVDHEEVPAP